MDRRPSVERALGFMLGDVENNDDFDISVRLFTLATWRVKEAN